MFYQAESQKHLKVVRKNTILVTSVVWILIYMPLWWGAGVKYKAYLFDKQRTQDTLELSLLRNSLRVSISKRLALLEGLCAFVESNPTEDLLTAESEIFMTGLYASAGGIRNFALAPDGIMRYVYPLKGNENVPGHDLMNDKRPNVKDDVRYAVKTRKTVLSGPYELRQGGTGLVARRAIFIDSSFWGLATMVVDMPLIYEEAGFFLKPSDVQVALRDKAGHVFFGEKDIFQKQPLIMELHLSDDKTWELAGIPVGGWQSSIKKDFFFFLATSFIIIVLMTLLTYVLINHQKLLQLEVNHKTKELQRWWYIFKNADWGVALEAANKSKIEMMNPAFAKIHGYSVDELAGAEISTLYDSDFRLELPAVINKCHELGHHTFEAHHVKKDGTPFPAYHDVTTVKGDGGEPLYRIVNVQDISERKQVEEELRQYRDHLEEIVRERTIALTDANKALLDSENRFRSLSDAAFEGIVLSEKGIILETNKTLAEMFGYQTNDFVGIEAIDLVVPDERKNVQDKILSGYEKPYETLGLKKDGTAFPIEVHAKMFSYKGRQVRVTAVRDLTENKRAQEALSESEKKYQDLYDNAPDMFVSVDAENATILQCNHRLTEVLGYSKDEILGRPVFEFYTPDSAEYAKSNVFPAFQETGIVKGEELKLQRKDGSIIDVSLNVRAFRDENGSIVHSNSVWRDITERKQAEKARREGERMQGVIEMAGAVCHEMNQPLMVIAGYSKLISMNISREDPLIEKISKLSDEVDRLGHITLKLMNITKYETKEYPKGKIIDIDKSSDETTII